MKKTATASIRIAGIDEQRAVERDGGIDQIVLAGYALVVLGFSDAARLHQRRMQIEIVRHHRGAQNADGDIQIFIGDMRDQARQHVLHHRPTGPADFDEETSANHGDQSQHKAFDHANPEAGEPQQQQSVGRGKQHAEEQRNVEQQVQRDGRAQHFRQIAGRDGNLAEEPQGVGNGARIGFAAGLRQIALGDDAQSRA